MMKKMYKIAAVVFSIILFTHCNGAEKVYEFSWKPVDYFKFLEDKIENYWRCTAAQGRDITDSDLKIIVETFRQGMKYLQTGLKNSGVFDIEQIEGKSYRNTGKNGKIFYVNDLSIEYDGDTKGFLGALLKKLPEDKIPDLPDSDVSDLMMIKDNTLMAFELPLNIDAAFKILPESERNSINVISEKNFDMKASEIADSLTGIWGGILNINKIKDSQNTEKFNLDFIFIIPDPGRKIFKKLGEYLVINKMAVATDDLINIRIFRQYREMSLLSSDEGFMILVSSPADLTAFSEHADKKEICRKIEELNVPKDIEYDAFVYWDREFSAFVNSLFMSKSHSLKFMHDFCASTCFSIIYPDDDEVVIKQYSDVSQAQQLLMPFGMNAMVHYDNLLYNHGRKKYFARKISASQEKCFENMKFMSRKLLEYADKYGNYPAGLNAVGLKELAKASGIGAEEFAVEIKNKRNVPFGRYYYWGENHRSRRADLPLLCDRGNIHKNVVHIIFCDGSVREFKLENVRSAKRIASFLHTVFRYDTATFAALLRQAEALDSEKL